MKVSAVMPVFNAARTVERALRSLLEQDFREPWEVVAVDDGSTDGSAEALEAFARRDGRVRVIRRPHEGIVAALNAGLAAARGRYIARMDADDECAPDRLRRQAALLDERPEIGIAGCRVRFGGDRERQAGYAAYVDWLNSLIEPEAIALNRFVESPFAHPSVMFRRELPERLGAYRDGPFPEDYELWLRWMDAGVKGAKVDAELVVWNDPPERLSRTDPRYAPEAFFRMKARYLARWLARHNRFHPEVTVWGAGRVTRRRAAFLEEEGVRITRFIDLKRRRPPCGRPVLTPEELPPPGRFFVVAMVGKRGAREEIRERLAAAGYREGRDFILGA